MECTIHLHYNLKDNIFTRVYRKYDMVLSWANAETKFEDMRLSQLTAECGGIEVFLQQFCATGILVVTMLH